MNQQIDSVRHQNSICGQLLSSELAVSCLQHSQAYKGTSVKGFQGPSFLSLYVGSQRRIACLYLFYYQVAIFTQA